LEKKELFRRPMEKNVGRLDGVKRVEATEAVVSQFPHYTNARSKAMSKAVHSFVGSASLRVLGVLMLVGMLAMTAQAQPRFFVPVTVTDGVDTYTLYFGIVPNAGFSAGIRQCWRTCRVLPAADAALRRL